MPLGDNVSTSDEEKKKAADLRRRINLP